MPTTSKYPAMLQVPIEKGTHDALKALAQRRDEAVAVVVRRILKQIIANEAALDGVDVITQVVRKAMKDVLKPTEDRLAAITAKGSIASATAMYLQTTILQDIGKRDVKETFETCRKKAVTYIRQKDGIEGG